MKVLIIGLKNKQLNELKEKHPEIYLTGLSSTDDQINRKKFPKGQQFDYILNATKFSSHAIHYHYHKFSHYIPLHGGKNFIDQKLTDLRRFRNE